MSTEKKILLADDHYVVRQGLKMLFNFHYPFFNVVEASDFSEIYDVFNNHKIDLIVLDATFPNGNSLAEIPKIKVISNHTKILMYTALDEDKVGVVYLNAGADGFISKLAEENEIRNAIDQMFSLGKYINSNLKEKIVNAYLNNELINPFEKLSSQEFQVMNLLVQGAGNLEICNSLDLKPTTVTTYKNRIFDKLDVKNIAELIEIHNRLLT